MTAIAGDAGPEPELKHDGSSISPAADAVRAPGLPQRNDLTVLSGSLSEGVPSESEQRYKRLLAAASDYLFTVTVENGQSVATSHGPGCVVVTGYTAEEFNGDPELWYRVIYEDDRAAVLAQIGQILKGETPPPVEHRIIHKDGSIRWVRNISVPHRDEQGEVAAYDGLISDITQRKQAEQLLLVQYTVTRELAEADTLPDALTRVLKTICESFFWDMAVFWRFDAKARLLRCSQTWHFPGARLEKFEAVTQTATFPAGEGLPGVVWSTGKPKWIPDVRDDADSPLTSSAERARLRAACAFPVGRGRETVGAIELFSRQAQQPDKPMLRSLAAVGRQIGQVFERKQAQDALKQALADLKASHEELEATQLELIQSAKLESLGTLAAGVAHEVKNPLQTILMGLSHVRHHVPVDDAAVAQTLNEMQDAVQRADTIVRDLLRLSASSTLELKPEDLNDVVERSLALVNYQLSAAGITVARELGAGLPRVHLDKMKMEQVFINLFINALQATRRGGTLTLRTKSGRWGEEGAGAGITVDQFKSGDPIVVAEVQDTGTGIPQENLPKLFNPFFTTKAAGVGTGLGLSIIKKIIDLHGGVIEIKNAPEGGTLVTLKLAVR